jgi:hypothetical protein
LYRQNRVLRLWQGGIKSLSEHWPRPRLSHFFISTKYEFEIAQNSLYFRLTKRTIKTLPKPYIPMLTAIFECVQCYNLPNDLGMRFKINGVLLA